MPRVRGYRLASCLGEGGTATVWRGERSADGRPVAVKVGRAGSDHARARFTREARALGAVGPPHAPELLESGELGDGRPYLVMELLEGRPLARELAGCARPLPLARVEALGDALLAALESVHEEGLVHRDLKPENALLRETEEGEALIALIDFGLAAAAGAGTPRYVAPEQIEGREEIDHRADLYAFGVILYEMVTGDVPFSGEAEAVKYGHLALRPPLPSERASMPAALEELILRCLSKDAEARPESAGEVRYDLAEACDGLAPRIGGGATGEAASALPASPTAPAEGQAGFARLGDLEADPDPRSEAELVGRGEVLARVERRWRQCVEEGTPGVFAVLGEPGLGKTRLFGEVAALAERLSPDATILRIRAEEGAPLSLDADRLRRRGAERPIAVLVDDAHRATRRALEVLEDASLGGEESALFVGVFADPSLVAGRPAWGKRAGWHERYELSPLAEREASALAAELLRAADPPAATLARLAAWAGGNPGCLEQLAAALEQAGYMELALAGGDAAAWEALAAGADGAVPGDELLEVIYLRARLALARGLLEEAARALDQARARLEEAPIWKARFAELEAELARLRGKAGSP